MHGGNRTPGIFPSKTVPRPNPVNVARGVGTVMFPRQFPMLQPAGNFGRRRDVITTFALGGRTCGTCLSRSNGLKREELAALNSTLLHELYFASLGGDGQPTKGMSEVLAQDFGIGCKTAVKLREAGFDAKYMNSGHSGWKAVGHPVRLHR